MALTPETIIMLCAMALVVAAAIFLVRWAKKDSKKTRTQKAMASCLRIAGIKAILGQNTRLSGALRDVVSAHDAYNSIGITTKGMTREESGLSIELALTQLRNSMEEARSAIGHADALEKHSHALKRAEESHAVNGGLRSAVELDEARQALINFVEKKK